MEEESISTVSLAVKTKSNSRSDEGWLETEWTDGSAHEAMRPAWHQTTAGQESEEP